MQFSNFAKFLKFLMEKFKTKDMLENKICSNIVPSARAGLRLGHQRGHQGAGQVEG